MQLGVDSMNFLAVIGQWRTWGVCGAFRAVLRLPHNLAIKRFLMRNLRDNLNARPEIGITVIAPISGAYSLSKTMRDFVIRMRNVGFPHQVFDTNCSDRKVSRNEYEELLTPKHEFNVYKYNCIVEMLTSPLPHNLPVRRCRIAFWESEAGLLDVYPYLCDADTVIAMSDYNFAYFRRTLPSSVNVAKLIYPLMPIPVGVLGKLEARMRFGIRPDDFVVFYNFDIRADYRKNPLGTLSAFCTAFKDIDSCKLVLKINGITACPEKMASIIGEAKKLGILRQIVIISEYLSQSDLYSLVNACDVYMSLHRGEGFGIGIAEAMQLAKPVVVTAYSAPLEFCNEETSILVPFRLITVDDNRLVSKMGPCADPDIPAAATALQRLYHDPGFAGKIGERGRQFVNHHFSDEAFKASIEGLVTRGDDNASR